MAEGGIAGIEFSLLYQCDVIMQKEIKSERRTVASKIEIVSSFRVVHFMKLRRSSKLIT